MEKLKKKARSLGGKNLKKSTRRGKKYSVEYLGKTIHFGSKGMSDFTIHKDKKRRDRYRARHSKILTKDGRLAYMLAQRPAFWSWNLLWS